MRTVASSGYASHSVMYGVHDGHSGCVALAGFLLVISNLCLFTLCGIVVDCSCTRNKIVSFSIYPVHFVFIRIPENWVCFDEVSYHVVGQRWSLFLTARYRRLVDTCLLHLAGYFRILGEPVSSRCSFCACCTV